MQITQIDLPDVDPARLKAAVRAAMEQQTEEMATPSVAPGVLKVKLPSLERLRVGAQEAQADGDPSELARYFQALVELGYLVAAADGLADEERQVLAELVEHATGKAVDQPALKLHFQDLEEGVGMLGRKERMQRAAAEFEDHVSRCEAISFAALVAVADGKLGAAEARALLELGEIFGLSEGEVRAVLGQVVQSIRLGLAE